MSEQHQIFLIGGAEDEAGVISMEPENDRCHIGFSYRGRCVEAAAADYFEAFCQVRLELEREELIPYCYGASLNVYPSGMGRDMGAGLKAYKMTVGYYTRIQDLVDIFASGPDVIPASVLSQREFFEEWLKTPKSHLTDPSDIPLPGPPSRR